MDINQFKVIITPTASKEIERNYLNDYYIWQKALNLEINSRLFQIFNKKCWKKTKYVIW